MFGHNIGEVNPLNWILQSERLGFRKITKDDFVSLCSILQDIDVMYAWEHAFTNEEVNEWIEKNLTRYKNEGFSYFAIIEKQSGAFIGVMGPLIENINRIAHIGIAYILSKQYWNLGFAFEGANACLQYAFNELQANQVIAQIRPNNLSSRKLAEKLGMQITGEYVKHYRGKDMPHLIYCCTKSV